MNDYYITLAGEEQGYRNLAEIALYTLFGIHRNVTSGRMQIEEALAIIGDVIEYAQAHSGETPTLLHERLINQMEPKTSLDDYFLAFFEIYVQVKDRVDRVVAEQGKKINGDMLLVQEGAVFFDASGPGPMDSFVIATLFQSKYAHLFEGNAVLLLTNRERDGSRVFRLRPLIKDTSNTGSVVRIDELIDYLRREVPEFRDPQECKGGGRARAGSLRRRDFELVTMVRVLRHISTFVAAMARPRLDVEDNDLVAAPLGAI